MTFKRQDVRTRRLVLRALKLADYEAWFDAYVNRHPAQSRWDAGPLPAGRCSRPFFRKLLKIHETLARKDDYYRFAVFVRGTHQFANFGYQIYNRHWGHGYGREAAAAGLRIGFRQLKLNRLEAAINLDNRKSIRLAKLIGMRREGIKKRYWFEDGRWIDHVIYVANPEDVGLRAVKPRL